MGLKANDEAKKDLIAQTFERNVDNQYFKQFKENFDDGILFPHNQKVYKKIVKGFSQGKKVLFEQATGTGKSYLAIKFLKDHAQGKKVLFVSPSNVIDNYFLDTLLKMLLNLDDESIYFYSKQHKLNLIKQKLNIDFDSCLYQGLKSKAEENYDIVIFDEAHRMGAPTWSKNVEILMENNPDALCLGMSATLDRNDGVDIKKFFNNREPVSRYSLVDAFDDDIMPNLQYTLAKVDFGEDEKFIDTSIADFKEKLKTASDEERKQINEFIKKLKNAKLMIHKCKDVPTIIQDRFNKPEMLNGKYIVFCPAGNEEFEEEEDVKSIHRMKSIMKQAEDWFSKVAGVKKIKKYSVYSKLGKEINHDIIKAFENDNSKSLKLLYAINMLNEGLHVNDIDGIIMMRGTSSRIIYFQELGRALSVGFKDTALVLDFVANLNYVDANEIRAIAKRINTGREKGNGCTFGSTGGSKKFDLIEENYTEIEFTEKLKKDIYNYEHWFEKFIRDLLEWKDKGHPNFENLTSKDCPFREVVNRVRLAKKGKIETKLTDDMIARLNEIGFPWEAEKIDWFEKFIRGLLEWKDKGHPNFENLTSEDCPLRDVVSGVRTSKKAFDAGEKPKYSYELDAEKIARLDAIGFPWKANDWFEEFYEKLLEWKEKDPTFKKLKTNNTPDCPFGATVGRVRTSKKAFDAGEKPKHNELDAEKIARLNEIGFPWEAEKIDWFEEFYENLLKWKVKHPNFENLMSQDCPFKNIVNCVRAAKKAFDAGKKPRNGYELDVEKIARLDMIGFPWEAVKDDAWFEKFIRNLLEWKDDDPTFKNLRTTNTPDCPFGAVVGHVRRAKKAFDKGEKPKGGYELDAEKIARLDAKGFPWEVRTRNKKATIVDDDMGVKQ